MGFLSKLLGIKEDTRPRCKYCNYVINDEAIFCDNCGKKLKDTELYKLCKYCGKKNKSDTINCINCGLNIIDYSKNYDNNIITKSKIEENYTKEKINVKKELFDDNLDKKKFYNDLIKKGIEEGFITYDDIADKVTEYTKPDIIDNYEETKDVYEQLADEFESIDSDIINDNQIINDISLLSNENKIFETSDDSKEIEDIMGLFSDDEEVAEDEYDYIPKRVYKLDNKFIIIGKYDDIKQASIENDIDLNSIKEATQDVKKYSGVYKWCYADEYLDRKIEFMSLLKKEELEKQILEDKRFLNDINDNLEELQNNNYISKESIKKLKDSQDKIKSCIDEVNNYRNGLSLPSTLLKSIELFIKKKQPAVYYSVIYGNYKSRLQHIKDIASLKKIIDSTMPSSFFKTKDYISTLESKTEVDRYIYSKLNEMDNFSIYDIHKVMPGLSWPCLEQLIESLLNDGCIKEIKGKDYNKYIKISRIKDNNTGVTDLNDNERTINTTGKINELNKKNDLILNEIFEILDTIKTDTISIKTLYARFKIFYPKELDDLDIKNHSDLETYLMKKYLHNGLYFKNSYISRLPISNVKYSIIKHFFTINKITKKDYDDFISTTGLSVAYNFYSLIRDVKELLLVSEDTAIRNENFLISEFDLKKINSILDMYFKNNENMFTKNINIKMFPNLDNYSMNKYLLISIINKYLSDKYETSLIDISTNNCDYLVRRIKNETN